MAEEFLLELRNISKQFPGVKALDNVQFNLRAGEVHTIMGENGAGKSTFIKIITGVHRPDTGQLFLNGKETVFHNPKQALDAGISAIYQHVTSYPTLSVTENIFMGHEEISPILKRINWKRMHKRAQDLLDDIGADFNANSIVERLSVAQQQMVEIAKALSVDAKIVIMDEPTASLTKRESEKLYQVTQELQKRKIGVIFVSHRMEDIHALATRVSVFRDAMYINTWDIDKIDEQELIYAMVGREIYQMYPKRNVTLGKVILKAENLSSVGYFKDINFEVRAGEILGVTGLIGAGRTELFQSLVGIMKLGTGTVYIEGKKVKLKHPSDALGYGIGYLPEDRQLQGLILEWSLVKNITLPTIDILSKYMLLNESEEVEHSYGFLQSLKVKAQSVFDTANSLSGGNQQKIVLAKLLSSTLKVIILDEPTKGVDVGAKAAIYEIINQLALKGNAIILISSEMSEVLGMSNRIIVMRSGRITKEFINHDITQEMVLEAAMMKKKTEVVS